MFIKDIKRSVFRSSSRFLLKARCFKHSRFAGNDRSSRYKLVYRNTSQLSRSTTVFSTSSVECIASSGSDTR